MPGRHVLIIEDNSDSREALTTLLTHWGHRVEAAEDGPRGVEMALHSHPEIALVDLSLPTMDGYQVARRLREAPEGREIYLVALSGFGGPDDLRRAREAGFDAHLVKPLNPEELSRTMASFRPLRANEG